MTVAALVAGHARLITVPLRRPWGPDVVEISVIEVRVRDAAGVEGTGFSWTPSIGGRAALALLEDHIIPVAIGRPALPEMWDDLWRHLHEAGGGGLTTIALAGLDLALWDLDARRSGQGIPEFLGRRHDRQPAYGSGVNLHYSLDDLVAQVGRWVDAGYRRVKVKVGKADLAEDLDRIAAVREVLGPDRELMIDANQRWDRDRAIRSAQAFVPYTIGWLEEPLRAEDLAGHVALRSEIPIPLALGENVHTLYRFREFIDAGAVDVIQPNIVRVGGITPFLRIAEFAASTGTTLAPHLLPELSAQLAFTLPGQTWVEIVEDAGFAELGVLVEPTGVVVSDGWVSGGPRLGLGFEFSRKAGSLS